MEAVPTKSAVASRTMSRIDALCGRNILIVVPERSMTWTMPMCVPRACMRVSGRRGRGVWADHAAIGNGDCGRRVLLAEHGRDVAAHALVLECGLVVVFVVLRVLRAVVGRVSPLSALCPVVVIASKLLTDYTLQLGRTLLCGRTGGCIVVAVVIVGVVLLRRVQRALAHVVWRRQRFGDGQRARGECMRGVDHAVVLRRRRAHGMRRASVPGACATPAFALASTHAGWPRRTRASRSPSAS
jgi:hypothetical protein